MRFLRFAALGLVAIGAVACSDDNDPTTPSIPPLAFVRYINAVPDTNSTTVRFIDQIEFTPDTWINTPFQGLGDGNYQATEAGARSFRVFTFDGSFSVEGNTAILVDTTITFEADKFYTLLHVGYARAGSSPQQRIVVFEDPVPGTAPAGVAVRALHAHPTAGTVDIYAAASTSAAPSGSPAFPGVSFLQASPYATVPTGPLAALVTAQGGSTTLISGAAPAGVAGSETADPIAGANVSGSALTAIAFPASVAGSRATSRTARVVWFPDRQPDRTVPIR